MNPQEQKTRDLLTQASKYTGIDPFAKPSTTKPVDASKLGNTQAYNLPSPNTTPTTGNLAQTTNQYVAQGNTTATAPEPTPISESSKTKQSYVDKILGIGSNSAEEINKINEDAKIAENKKTYLGLKNELDVFDKQYRDEIKTIKENREGKFGGAIEQDLRKAEERYQDVRSNKVLSVNSALGEYQVANDIATSKIQALKDQNAQQIEAYKLGIDAINNDLTESEKLQVQANLQEKQLKAKSIEDAYAQAIQTGLDNGAGQSYFNALDNAKQTGNISALASTVSQYGYKTLDQQLQQAQLSNANLSIRKDLLDLANAGDPQAIKQLGLDPNAKKQLTAKEVATVQKEITANDAYKALQKSKDSLTALKEYEKTFNKVGTTSGLTSPFDNAKLKTSYNTATLNLKEFFNLGVLNGPDLEVIQGVLGKPTDQGLPGVGNVVSGTGAKAGIQNMYKQIEASLDDRYLNLSSQYGQYDASQVGILNDLNRTYLQTKAQVNPEVAKFLKENPNLPIEDAVRVINTKL